MPKLDIEKEISEMGEKVEKSIDPREVLFETLTKLGPEGIRERMSTLNDEDKVVLKAALQEMSLRKAKSIEFDKEAQGAKHIQGNIMDTIIQEEVGNDEADEKLVKPEAAKHNHQGNSVVGWEGQVIKGKDGEDFKKLKNELSHEKGVYNPAGLAAKIGREKMGKEAFDAKAAAGHKKSVKKAGQEEVDEPQNAARSMKLKMEEEKRQKDDMDKIGNFKEGKNTVKKSAQEVYQDLKKAKDEAKAQESLLIKAICKMCGEQGKKPEDVQERLEKRGGMSSKKAKKMMKKAMKKMAMKEAKAKIMAMEEKEHGTKDPKELVEEEKKEHGMKKAIEGDHDKGRILQEEDQLGNTDQMTEEGKDMADESQDPAKANKQAQKDVNNMKIGEQMKKAVNWSPEDALLKAGTGGRNFTFNVGDFVEEMIKADEKMKMKPGQEDEEDGEKEEKCSAAKMPMKKSINDLIEKSEDESQFQEDMKKNLAAQAGTQTGKLVKSFNEVTDLAQLLGLSEEEAKKILG